MIILSICYGAEPLMSDEKRLIRRLLRYYDHVGVVGRPVHNQSQTVFVKYGLALVQIIGLDEKNQILTTNVWSRYVSVSASYQIMNRSVDQITNSKLT